MKTMGRKYKLANPNSAKNKESSLPLAKPEPIILPIIKNMHREIFFILLTLYGV
ncbi:MAG: hypothetical protein PHC47_04140 [Clostridia bacterium]|nr:hypothetical protein [Clostridia bacterium]